MTLCEIVGKAKDGDRFQAEWQKEHGNVYYYYKKGKQVWCHYETFQDTPAEFQNIDALSADYTFLPPEPKFKVGDRVKVIDTYKKGSTFVISDAGPHDTTYGWLYWSKSPSLKYWESQIELAPDTCEECGQEIQTTCKNYEPIPKDEEAP